MNAGVKIAATVTFVAALAFVAGRIYLGKNRTTNDTGKRPASVSGVSIEKPVENTPLVTKAGYNMNSKAAVVINVNTGEIIFADNAFQSLPMASLTKLMSAMVSLDNKVNLQSAVSIPPNYFTIGGNLRIVPGSETVLVRDLLYASITGSANNAALSLAKETKLTEKEFSNAMNRKAIELGLETLHYEEPSGLSPKNTGSAYDVARLAGIAFTKYPLILDAASKGSYVMHTQNTQREHTIKNPNKLFEREPGKFLASKTGYLDEALYCLVLAKNTPGGMLVAVTLGNPSSDDSETETLRILSDAEKVVAARVDKDI